MTIAIDSPITNDSFLNLLEELRNELDSIITENNTPVKHTIDNSAFKGQQIIDTLCADIVAKHAHKNSGYTHVKDALPANTENNDALYVGINQNGTACIFNYIHQIIFIGEYRGSKSPIECWYKNDSNNLKIMTGLLWWKILERPTTSDFFYEGSQAFNLGISINENPYQKNTNEAQHWELGWKSTSDLPF